MEQAMLDCLASIQLGELQVHKNLAVIPLFTKFRAAYPFITLGEALESKQLVVTEESQSGSVPELKVKNHGAAPVLLLDGEEVSGAKQNRVLNTTILIAPFTEVLIPVSCTEHGRWSYVSDSFVASGHLLERSARRDKSRSVSRSLVMGQHFRSDQGEVWDNIERLQASAQVRSESGAMRDVYEYRGADLDEYLAAFPHVAGQKGMLVFINGQVAGFDLLLKKRAYEELHPKLLKSYAMEALLAPAGRKRPTLAKAKAFMAAVASCDEKRYRSVGLGWDCRFEGKGHVGSALLFHDRIIHATFFACEAEDQSGPMSDYRTRRDNRIRIIYEGRKEEVPPINLDAGPYNADWI
ncbi:MAG: ARPP-1 family domain-containing protein [Candidatus Geothermincolia bacterium]